MRNMSKRLERLETASGTVTLPYMLHASEDEQKRIIKNLSDADIDRFIDELKAGVECDEQTETPD